MPDADRMTLDGDLIVEIKVPFKGQQSTLWQSVAGGEVPAYYGAQIQHQLMVTGARQAHLWVFDGQIGLLRTIEPEPAAADMIRGAWDAFAVFLDTDTPPPLVDADTVVRDDAAWAAAARDYAQAKQAATASDEALDRAKAALVALAGHPREQGAGVSVTRYWKAGNVDYKKVVELRGVDLEQYPGRGREEVRVTTAT